MQDGPTATPTQLALLEAFELQNLQTNTSLLEYGLQMGFIKLRTHSGRLTMELLNAYPMSPWKLVQSLLLETFMRLGIFIPAIGLVKLALDSDSDSNQTSTTTATTTPNRHSSSESNHHEGTLRLFYVLFIIAHQFSYFDDTSIRSMHRLFMCIAIILFSWTTTNSPPCKDMIKFKKKIQHKLRIDYYLWCLLLAMDLVSTCSTPVHISPERYYGIESHMVQVLLSTFCVSHLSCSMRMIGHGRLVPIIIGTPLIFLDAGEDITLVKAITLVCCYLCFWCLDWRELVDWNHTMLCEAGICKILASEQGNLKHIARTAKRKFDYWRMEEGLDDDGWFILLDAPAAQSSVRSQQARETSEQADEDSSQESTSNQAAEEETPSSSSSSSSSSSDEQTEPNSHRDQNVTRQQLLDYSERLVYLQSRNPLLTSLAAIMLMIWK